MSLPAEAEAAVARLVADLCGLPFYWADQELNQPAGDYVRGRLGDLLPLADMDQVEELEVEDAPAGEEIAVVLSGQREVTLGLQAFTDATVAGDADGRVPAARVLARFQARVQLPAARARLEAVGLSLVDLGRVQNLSALRTADFEGRASLDLLLGAVETAEERTGYIATAVVTEDRGGVDVVHTVELPD